MTDKKETDQNKKLPIDTQDVPVLSSTQTGTLINRMYGVRQAALSLVAQTEATIEYLHRKKLNK